MCGQRTDTVGNIFFLLHSIGVLTWAAYEKLCQKYYASKEIQDCFSDLCEVEDDWDHFLVDCDRTWQSPVDYCHVKKQQIRRLGPLNVKLTDARTGRESTLGSHLDGCRSLVLVLLRHFA
ncbi:hypothetical protein BSL78_08841 [Apostichopus japonicus]|uniref:Uncharacterized protein n=1 Tax=Stichopus japonicus TaxID=307972 RepID=A0A2G8L1X9_STIJA|nr:hypothetical protein BSL78_08841 [Apostichopus japonicus]